ncbi:MAG TPA: hypothetical protein VL463_16745, partial [Kofleriaceae bacterium]|nr:hypothetical protein [Kofleriaceae bacterium]
IDPAGLPDLAGSIGATSTIQLIGLADGKRYPIQVTFQEQAGVYGAPDLIAAVPLQGVPLSPGTYAAVITTDLHDAGGAPLDAATSGELDRWSAQLDALAQAGITREHIAGLTVFTTGNATSALAQARVAALAQPLPQPTAFTRTDLFTDFCAYHATIDMPDYQSGTPPFDGTGGTWQLDANGAPMIQRTETANLVVTLPRTPPPADGYPIVVFVRTGGGGDRPLVDRGQETTHGGPPLEPGEGPARYLARAGFAGIEVDGPLGGLRNTTNGDEQFLTFNVTNLGAMRDNIRESALELQILAHVAVGLHMNATDCPAAGTTDPGSANVGFDAAHVAIMGHSMGAWIAPLAAADEPLFRAMILSGAGGSWIENIMWKTKPTPVYPVIAAFLHESDLRADDPVLGLSQWALESADPQVYTQAFIARGGHVLMEQGIVDDYILPNIANATSLSFGLDLAGTELDTENDPRLADQRPLGPQLALVGRRAIALPASANHGASTAVVVQHLEDGIEDGHEVLFQTDAPKHQYQCFLRSWIAKGKPIVDVDAARDAPCPP